MNYLFVCNGNVARSQEAEYFFNDLSEDDIAKSAGVNAKVGKPLDPLVLEVMQEIDYGMPGAHRKLITKEMADWAHKIISFKSLDELPDYVQERKDDIELWDVPDPQHQPLEFHRRVRDDILRRIENLLQ
jgi:protein-tyrosine-phosphatase